MFPTATLATSRFDARADIDVQAASCADAEGLDEELDGLATRVRVGAERAERDDGIPYRRREWRESGPECAKDPTRLPDPQ